MAMMILLEFLPPCSSSKSTSDSFDHCFQLQLVFLVFTGEAWGYLGSRRFLSELELHTDAVLGINSTLIDMVHIYLSDSWVHDCEFFNSSRSLIGGVIKVLTSNGNWIRGKGLSSGNQINFCSCHWGEN
ncbi:hypothetical protein RJ641_006400 [Dillenia turbinata]|uniref:Uncharacterized protein n=1 Tax=Dillenia turbinata TaxID=194707 RepID=A0AAN8Z619_9MAGN